MKFELVEPPEPLIPDMSAAPQAPPPPRRGPKARTDPAAGLAVVTERLTTEVAAQIERIDVSVGELTAAVAALPERESSRARPPGNFRPDRFGAAGDKRRHHP